MTLCGVLKDILLVAASMLIWQAPVTGLQFFGYSIALGGLVWYKLGADKMREYTAGASRAWAEYGNTKPAQRRFVVLGATILMFILFVGSLAPNATNDGYGRVKGYLGGATAGNA